MYSFKNLNFIITTAFCLPHSHGFTSHPPTLKGRWRIKKRIAWTHPKCIFVFCLSGVSIEFLCFPRPEEPLEHVMSCLRALFTLLDSPCAKIHIAEDQVKTQSESECRNYTCKEKKLWWKICTAIPEFEFCLKCYAELHIQCDILNKIYM